MKATASIALMVIGFLLIIFGLSYFGLNMDRFFAPRQEALRRQVFEQSNSYNSGMVRDLENIQMQYNSATPEQKVGLRAIAIHRFEVYPEESLPSNLANFYNQLRNSQ